MPGRQTPAKPWRDAIALVRAKARHDDAAVQRVLTKCADVDALMITLAAMVITGVQTYGRTVEEYLEVQAEQTRRGVNAR